MINYRTALDLHDGIPGIIRDELGDCPETGTGERRVFRWIFRMVKRLSPYCTRQKILSLMRKASVDCGREVPDSEIIGAINAADKHQHRGETINVGISQDVGARKSLAERKTELEADIQKITEDIEYTKRRMIKESFPLSIGYMEKNSMPRYMGLLAKAREHLEGITRLETAPVERFYAYERKVALEESIHSSEKMLDDFASVRIIYDKRLHHARTTPEAAADAARMSVVVGNLMVSLRKRIAREQEQLEVLNWFATPPAERFAAYVKIGADCHEALETLARWRGLSVGVFKWLIAQGSLGISYDKRERWRRGGKLLLNVEFWQTVTAAFPVHDIDGMIVAIHHRIIPLNNRSSTFSWFYDPSGVKPTPLIIGDIATADLVVFAESTWDPIAFLDCFELHRQTEIRWATVITRGSSNAARVPIDLKPDASILILAQNDNANSKWVASLPQSIRSRARLITPPQTMKDFNDWVKAVGTKQIRENLVIL